MPGRGGFGAVPGAMSGCGGRGPRARAASTSRAKAAARSGGTACSHSAVICFTRAFPAARCSRSYLDLFVIWSSPRIPGISADWDNHIALIDDACPADRSNAPASGARGRRPALGRDPPEAGAAHTMMTTLPRAWRVSRYRMAAAASASGYVLKMTGAIRCPARSGGMVGARRVTSLGVRPALHLAVPGWVAPLPYPAGEATAQRGTSSP